MFPREELTRPVLKVNFQFVATNTNYQPFHSSYEITILLPGETNTFEYEKFRILQTKVLKFAFTLCRCKNRFLEILEKYRGNRVGIVDVEIDE